MITDTKGFDIWRDADGSEQFLDEIIRLLY
jgi:hypothetical protein